MLRREEVDTRLGGELAAIVRETFAAEERANARGWDGMPTVMLQYLRDDTAPSSVAVVPAALVQLGDTPRAVGFLVQMLTSHEADAVDVRRRLIRFDSQGYLGCAIGFEGYLYPGSRQEREERYGKRPLADVPESVEIRSLRGITVEGRRFEVIRARGEGDRDDEVVGAVDFPRGEDETHPTTALNILIEQVNQALNDAYRRLSPGADA